MIDVMDALVFLHTPSESKGVELHLDFKPSNVLLDAEGRAFLCDAGLAHGMTHGVTHVTLVVVQGSTGFIDPLYNESQRVSPMTDGCAPRCYCLSPHP